MELKEAILSTLAEMEQKGINPGQTAEASSEQKPQTCPETKERPIKTDHSDELIFLQRLRERLLVLFEGFQSPNNRNIEAKVDLTLNFLEFLLSALDERIGNLKKESL